MLDHGLGRWGAFLEAELTGLQLVTVHALTSGSIDVPSAWIRGRITEPTLYFNRDAVMAAVDAIWLPDLVFYWREIPSVCFQTAHGNVIVTDLWGDTHYRTLRGVKARPALRLDAPLIRAAERVEMLCHKGSRSPVLVTLAHHELVEPLLLRAPLRAWSSHAAADEEAGEVCAWIAEANDYGRADARAVMREFRAVNPEAREAHH